MEFLKQLTGYDGWVAWLAFRRIRERWFVAGSVAIDAVDH